jgi:hypothetical protein
VPSGSEAVAARFTVAGAVKPVPSAGWASVTAGGESPSTDTMRASDGTPWASTTNSMYTPGGATLALAGAVAVTLVAPAVNDSGT